MMRRLAILLAVGVLCGACGGDRAASGGAGEDGAAAAAPLVLLLDVPATVRAGDEVTVAVTLANRGAAPVQVGPISPDVVVTRGDGSEVWRRSRHEPHSASPATSEASASALRPNEMRGSGYAWNQRDDAGQPVPPGTYRVRAEAAAPKLASEPRAITIQP
jgi:hypothetical protein